jgi:hypothetical protein
MAWKNLKSTDPRKRGAVIALKREAARRRNDAFPTGSGRATNVQYDPATGVVRGDVVWPEAHGPAPQRGLVTVPLPELREQPRPAAEPELKELPLESQGVGAGIVITGHSLWDIRRDVAEAVGNDNLRRILNVATEEADAAMERALVREVAALGYSLTVETSNRGRRDPGPVTDHLEEFLRAALAPTGTDGAVIVPGSHDRN